LDGKFASWFGLTPVVDQAARNPNILNGGLEKVNPLYWAAILGIATFVDIYQINKANSGNPEYFAGNLNFDPLGFYPKDKAGQLRMQAAEIRHGRLAMIAIAAFVAQEYVQKTGVVEHSSIFFKPLGF
jgi:light-harvesting complex II chlorophyll a/b binding protein 5